jgi:hypothetical protein
MEEVKNKTVDIQRQSKQQRLAILNMFAVQKERALMVLMKLQNRGVSLDEIG